MQFDVITIFPKIFDSYLKESLIKRSQEKKLIKINIHNLRNFSQDPHKKVALRQGLRVSLSRTPQGNLEPRRKIDDKPYGGGRGMVMMVEPIYKAVTALKSQIPKSKTILFSPRGKKFNQKLAYQFSKLDQLILICGRYEGVDERVAKHLADMELSIGDYDLMGGELPAMIVIETIARLIPGVLGKPQLLKERTTKEKGFIEYSQYTRPEVFSPKKRVYWKVPKVLLSGHHKKIEEWRKKHSKIILS